MEIILYVVLFFFILFFIKPLLKTLFITSNAVSNVVTQASLLYEDTTEEALERYSLACEILELHKSYLTNDEYQELYNIIHQRDRIINLREEAEQHLINMLLRQEVKYSKALIERKKHIDKYGFSDFFKDL